MKCKIIEKAEKQFIVLDGCLIEFYIKRKQIKNMYMRISNDGELIVTVSKYYSIDMIKNFIAAKKKWVFKQLEFHKNIEKEKEQPILENGNRVYFLGKKYELKIFAR